MRTVTATGALAVILSAFGCDDGSTSGASRADDGGLSLAGDDAGAPPLTAADGATPSCPQCTDGSAVDNSCSLVDLIIAVDGSSSMTEELEALRKTVFPAFADRLTRVGKGLRNFRVATIDACPNPASYHTRGAGGACNFSSGEAWIDSTSPDLKDEFACVGDLYQADVKCSGNNDDEQPASAAAASLEAPFVDGVNKGFSRPDALLIVLAITDEDEQPTGTARTAQQIYERLVATKGDVKRMVFIGIGGGRSCKGVYGSASESVKLKSTTQKFIEQDRGVWHDLCAGALEDSLDKAFQVIDQACDELPIVI